MIKINFTFKTLKYLFVFTLLLNPLQSFAEVGKKEFESIEKVSKYILTHYPKDQYIYVGVGRSPVPVMAYLRSEENTLVRNVPLTRFRYGTGYCPKLSPSEEARLYQHFDEYLPHDSELNGRKKILMVDFAFEGGTIAAARSYLNSYIENHRKSLTAAQGVAISLESDAKALVSTYPALDVLPLMGSRTQADSENFDHFLIMMVARLYMDRAEYEGFDIRNPTRLKARHEYQEYVKEIKAAKLKYKLGILNDDWTNTLFDLMRNPEKYDAEMKMLRGINRNLSDTESTKIENDTVSKVVARKRIKAKYSEVRDPVKALTEQLRSNPSLTGLDESNASLCDEGRRVLQKALVSKPLLKLDLGMRSKL